MRNVTKHGFISLLLSAFVVSSQAAACELTKNEFDVYVGRDCRLEDFIKNLPPLQPTRTYQLKLPNLRIRNFKYNSSGNSIEFLVNIKNDGQASAGSFRAIFEIEVIDPLSASNMPAISNRQFSLSVDKLDAGQEQTFSIDYFSVPDRDQDWDISTHGNVDPAQSRNGDVLESNEHDNEKDFLCRMPGREPDLTVPICQPGL